MSITEETVRYMAKSSAIELTNEEVAQMQEYLGQMVEHMDKMVKVETEGVPLTTYVHEMTNIFTEDVHRGEALPSEKLEAMSPHFQNGYFKVPKIINN